MLLTISFLLTLLDRLGTCPSSVKSTLDFISNVVSTFTVHVSHFSGSRREPDRLSGVFGETNPLLGEVILSSPIVPISSAKGDLDSFPRGAVGCIDTTALAGRLSFWLIGPVIVDVTVDLR
jgi:hypothetical protein